MKWIKNIALGLLSSILMLLAIFSWIINTKTGLQLSLNTAMNWLPGLKITTVSGNWSNLNLEGINYQNNNININISKLNLSLKLNNLKHFQLYANNILIKDLNIKIDTKSYSFSNQQVNYKFLLKYLISHHILLNQLIFKNINIQFDKTQFLLTELTMSAGWKNNLLTINPILINGLVVNLSKNIVKTNKTFKKTMIKVINTIVDESFIGIPNTIFHKILLFNISKVMLPININICLFQGINWHIVKGNTDIIIDNVMLVADVQNQQIIIKQFDIVAPKGKITLKSNIDLAKQYQVEINLTSVLFLDNFRKQQIYLKLEGNLLQEIKLILNLIGPIKANLVTKIELLKEGLPIQLLLDSKQFNWPLNGKSKYYLNSFHFSLNGNMVNHNLLLYANINEINISSILLNFNSKKNKEEFVLTNKQFNCLENKTKLNKINSCSTILYCNKLLTLLLNNDVIKQWSQWLTKLQGKILIKSSLYNNNWQLKISEILLYNKSKGTLLQIKGQVNRNAIGKWNFSDIDILFGNNKLNINGDLYDKWKLIGIINIQDLNSILPILSGVIKGKFQLYGTLQSPKFITDIVVKKIQWKNNSSSDQKVIQGHFNSKIEINWYKSNYLPEIKVIFFGKNIEIKQLIRNSFLLLKFQLLILNININNYNAGLEWLLQIDDNSKFLGNIQMNDLRQTRKLSGTIDIKNISLSLVYPFLSKCEKLDGNLTAHLKLIGNMKQLLLDGSITLSNVTTKIKYSPFNVNDSFSKLNFDGINSQLILNIITSEGYLKLIGELSWDEIEFLKAKFFIVGNKLRITFPSMIYIDLEPDIIFEITSDLLSISGSIKIPHANIIIHDLPKSTIPISTDEVILDSNIQLINKKSILIPILINLEIKVGDNICLDAFGLKSRLTGTLKIIKNTEGINLNGQINILEGKFKVYNKDLIIRKGQILYSGPIDQPFLNIEAICNPENISDNIVVGIRVIGLIDKLETIFFSEPIKSQHEILFYLFGGKELSNNDEDNAHAIALFINMIISKSGKLLGNIGEIFGVSDLTLNTKGIGNKFQVIISGKITNNLQIRYGVRIFNSLTTLTLRYCLIPNLYLESVLGINQALDLLYHFEF